MDVIFVWLIGGVAGLVLGAAGVAAWEQLRRSVRPQEEFTSAAPRAVNIDVRLDRLAAPDEAPAALPQPAAGDAARRRAALDQVLARMAQPAAAADAGNPQHWAETTPMVAPGALADPAATGAAPREFSPSQQP